MPLHAPGQLASTTRRQKRGMETGLLPIAKDEHTVKIRCSTTKHLVQMAEFAVELWQRQVWRQPHSITDMPNNQADRAFVHVAATYCFGGELYSARLEATGLALDGPASLRWQPLYYTNTESFSSKPCRKQPTSYTTAA